MAVSARANTCAQTVPQIGVVGSWEKNGDILRIKLEHAAVFDAGKLASEREANMDAYAELASGYKAAGLTVPSSFALPLQGYEKNAIGSLYLSASALGRPLKKGEVAVQGPPNGGFCVQYGLTAFFDSGGRLLTAVVDDPSRWPVSYGGEQLKMGSGPDYACETGQDRMDGADCLRDITYTLGKSSFTLKPGQEHYVPGKRFSKIALIRSGAKIAPPDMIGGGFGPYLIQRIDFR